MRLQILLWTVLWLGAEGVPLIPSWGFCGVYLPQWPKILISFCLLNW